MQSRKLGTQGLEVSEIGFGCMGLTGVYNAALPEADAMAVLNRAVELGVTFFDTAELYGPFANEKLVGKALKPVRDRVVIATKFGFKIEPGASRPSGVDSRPEHIREVCDASLQRLGVETIDLLYQHRVDPAVPIEDVAGAVGELVKAGKVRFFGLSEAGAETIRKANAVHPVSAVQSEYSLWTRDVEKEVLPTCRKLGVGFVPYSPLGRGFLAGSASAAGSALNQNDFRRFMPRWQDEAMARNRGLVETLTALAKAKGHTPAQLAIAWLLHQGPDIAPIPGTTKIGRLEENLGASGIQLSAAELGEIERAVPESAVEGGRYDDSGLAMVNL
jgi:aryl-alcohol dehydrogenase-like predicted oxidoreductase